VTAAIALAVVLVIAVAGASMALESQRSQPATRRPSRPAGPDRRPAAEPERPRRPTWGRSRPDPTSADRPPAPAPDLPEPELKGPDLLRIGESAEAKVISVVDERTIGPVTRSRLQLRIEPAGGDPFEVTIRVAFQTPEARSRVKVGGTVPVRYDPDDHSRVVVDVPQG
jgi:hypothetical protein